MGRFNQTWYQPYAGQHKQLQGIPWHVVAGNHDWEGNVTAEVEMTNLLGLPWSGTWNMPSLYYTFTEMIPFSEQSVQFIMLDTETLCGGDAGQPDSAPSNLPQPPIDEVQWTWVTQLLATSVADWIIVVGHFPVYSVGANGPTPALVTRLLPLMDAAGVALYISGHDHQLEHITPAPGSNVDFLVVGAASKFNASADNSDNIPPDTLAFNYGIGCGFASIYVSRRGYKASTLTVTLWGGSGPALYAFEKANPRAAYLPPAPPRPPGPPSPFFNPAGRQAIMVGCLLAATGLVAICLTVGQEKEVGGGGGGGGMGGAGGTLKVWIDPMVGKVTGLGGGAVPLGGGANERASLLLQQRGVKPQGSAQALANRL